MNCKILFALFCIFTNTLYAETSIAKYLSFSQESEKIVTATKAVTLVNPSKHNIVAVLPDPSTKKGETIYIKRNDSPDSEDKIYNIIQIQTIETKVIHTMMYLMETLKLKSDGTQWHIIENGTFKKIKAQEKS